MLLHFNRGLSRQFAWRVKRAGSEVAFGELILAGDEALLKAALKWDPKKGAKFSTYAFQRVHRAIVGYMMEHEDVIKIPVHMKELHFKIGRAQSQLTQVCCQISPCLLAIQLLEISEFCEPDVFSMSTDNRFSTALLPIQTDTGTWLEGCGETVVC